MTARIRHDHAPFARVRVICVITHFIAHIDSAEIQGFHGDLDGTDWVCRPRHRNGIGAAVCGTIFNNNFNLIRLASLQRNLPRSIAAVNADVVYCDSSRVVGGGGDGDARRTIGNRNDIVFRPGEESGGEVAVADGQVFESRAEYYLVGIFGPAACIVPGGPGGHKNGGEVGSPKGLPP